MSFKRICQCERKICLWCKSFNEIKNSFILQNEKCLRQIVSHTTVGQNRYFGILCFDILGGYTVSWRESESIESIDGKMLERYYASLRRELSDTVSSLTKLLTNTEYYIPHLEDSFLGPTKMENDIIQRNIKLQTKKELKA